MLTQVKHSPNLNRPEYLTAKAEHIKIGGHIIYPYDDQAAMLSKRGEKDKSYALPVNGGQDPTPAGTVPPLTI